MKDDGMVYEDEITPFPKEMFDALAERIKDYPIKGIMLTGPLNNHFIQEPGKILGMPKHGAMVDDALPWPEQNSD